MTVILFAEIKAPQLFIENAGVFDLNGDWSGRKGVVDRECGLLILLVEADFRRLAGLACGDRDFLKNLCPPHSAPPAPPALTKSEGEWFPRRKCFLKNRE